VVDTLATKLSQRGIRDMRVYDVSEFDPSYMVAEAWKYSHIVIATPTYNTKMFYLVHNLLHELAALNLSNRKFSLIVNSSWGGSALEALQEVISTMKNVEIVGEPLIIHSTMKDHDIPKIEAFADAIAESIKTSKTT